MSVIGLSVFDMQSVSDGVLLRFVHRFKKQDLHPDVHSHCGDAVLKGSLTHYST